MKCFRFVGMEDAGNGMAQQLVSILVENRLHTAMTR